MRVYVVLVIWAVAVIGVVSSESEKSASLSQLEPDNLTNLAVNAVVELKQVASDASISEEDQGVIEQAIQLLYRLATGSLRAVNIVTKLEDGRLSDESPAMMAVIKSDQPHLRENGEAFLSVCGEDENSKKLRAISGFAQMYIDAVERIGVQLPYGFTLRIMDNSHMEDAQAIVYDAASGVVELHPRWAELIVNIPLEIVSEAYTVMAHDLPSIEASSALERLVKMAQRTLEAVKYNMWECIVCIIVLGIAFPMAANFLLAAIVQFLCHELHIVPQTCAQYLLSVLLLINVLLPLFAYAIFKICKLQSKACTSGLM